MERPSNAALSAAHMVQSVEQVVSAVQGPLGSSSQTLAEELVMLHVDQGFFQRPAGMGAYSLELSLLAVCLAELIGRQKVAVQKKHRNAAPGSALKLRLVESRPTMTGVPLLDCVLSKVATRCPKRMLRSRKSVSLASLVEAQTVGELTDRTLRCLQVRRVLGESSGHGLYRVEDETPLRRIQSLHPTGNELSRRLSLLSKLKVQRVSQQLRPRPTAVHLHPELVCKQVVVRGACSRVAHPEPTRARRVTHVCSIARATPRGQRRTVHAGAVCVDESTCASLPSRGRSLMPSCVHQRQSARLRPVPV